ncbi:MAG: phenylalanine--tRNA ligase subunit alpha, partial [Clostridiales bacterium]|nr:phenylalanine--tRNA ligase subunit alpha [Clostridiales bacterium]
MKKPEEILTEAKRLIAEARDGAAVEELRIRYLGKKGELTALLRSMGEIELEARKAFGMAVNSAKDALETRLAERKQEFAASGRSLRLAAEKIDVTEPGRPVYAGTKHLITLTIEEICGIFTNMGYSITEGPEVETVFYNFDALNAAPNHPSRELSDTFYISDEILL